MCPTELSKEQKEILRQLRLLWKQFPDLRLGQLLENHVFSQGQRGDKTSVSLFYQEDSKTLIVMKQLLKKIRDKEK
jgi:hypothetical protein